MKQSILLSWGVAATLDGIGLITRGAVDFNVNPTLASGDVKLEKDGGTAANLTTLPAVTPSGGKSVRVSLAAAETECARGVIWFVDQTSPKEWEDEPVYFHTPLAEGAICGKITSGTPSATAFRSSQLTQSGTDIFGGGTSGDAFVTMLTGANAGGTRKITGFDPANDELSFEAFPTAPSVGDVFEIVNGA